MCEYLAEMNKTLKPRNCMIDLAFQVTDDHKLIARIKIATEKLDTGKPVPIVVASCCPFCGEKYVD